MGHHVDNFRGVFRLLDVDGDECINKDELLRILKNCESIFAISQSNETLNKFSFHHFFDIFT